MNTTEMGSLYERVASQLKQEVLSGLYPVGTKLPSEKLLSERFAVSRHTVREALRCLRDEGLVSSRQGAGSVVASPLKPGSDTHELMSIDDLLAFAADTQFVVKDIKLVELGEQEAKQLALPVGEQRLWVRGNRFSREAAEIKCRTEFYIHRRYAAVARILPHHQGPIFPILETMFGLNIVAVEQQISAVILAADLSRELAVDEGTPALEVRRAYRDAEGQVAQVTLNTHPASRFKHLMTIHRMKSPK